MTPWLCGAMIPCSYESMNLWLFKATTLWSYVAVDLCCCGSMQLWSYVAVELCSCAAMNVWIYEPMELCLRVPMLSMKLTLWFNEIVWIWICGTMSLWNCTWQSFHWGLWVGASVNLCNWLLHIHTHENGSSSNHSGRLSSSFYQKTLSSCG